MNKKGGGMKKRRHGWRVLWLVAACLCPLVQGAQPVYLPPPESVTDHRSDYQFQLLQLALQEDGHRFQALRGQQAMPQARALGELAACQPGVDVVASMTTIERESRLLPIRIPIDRGLIGWRIALIRAEQPERLANVDSLATLAQLTAGQGPDWPDTRILRANGLPVNSSGQYDALFRMLQNRRFDYFPRSVNEIWPELDRYRQAGLGVDRHLVLHYPAAVYFFVCPHNQVLAEAIRHGLEKALRDNRFNQLFTQYYQDALSRADLGHRTIIELANPELPPQTPLQRQDLWLRIEASGRQPGK
ncbi:transporter substrate-binding domain-containing protein [Paludibacterium sp. THUN1379]|uniref:hypothetical protein n=1 Tax=Paludibacterium sp. THUN1379 TaxID=3112107 RepID=UPI0030927104|nr:transporter substrate-binding domain-containing protein [Paludibacterium sp. THUN1379]